MKSSLRGKAIVEILAYRRLPGSFEVISIYIFISRRNFSEISFAKVVVSLDRLSSENRPPTLIHGNDQK